MAKLTADMKDFIEKQRDPVTVFIGTSSRDNVPNISAKGTFIHIVDDENLAYADVYSKKTAENVKRNHRVTIAVINSKTYKGYQFKGRGEIIQSGSLLDLAKKQNPQAQTVTKVKIEDIYFMDYGPKAGEKVA